MMEESVFKDKQMRLGVNEGGDDRRGEKGAGAMREGRGNKKLIR